MTLGPECRHTRLPLFSQASLIRLPSARFHPAGRLATRDFNHKWTMEDCAGPIIYGVDCAFTRVCARVRVGVRRVHVTAGLCCAIVKKKWRRDEIVPRPKYIRDSCLTRFCEKTSNRNRTVGERFFFFFVPSLSSLSSRKSERTSQSEQIPMSTR